MGVSGQRHVPAALLPPGKGPPVPIVQGAGWAPEPVWTQARGKILCPRRGSNPDRPVVQPVVRHYTAWATPAVRHRYRTYLTRKTDVKFWRFGTFNLRRASCQVSWALTNRTCYRLDAKYRLLGRFLLLKSPRASIDVFRINATGEVIVACSFYSDLNRVT
jgi:hypothetical protein